MAFALNAPAQRVPQFLLYIATIYICARQSEAQCICGVTANGEALDQL